MSNEQWHENIPPQGVLCKNKEGLMINVSEVDDTFAYNIQDNSLKIIRLTPVTAQEWWEFAPWQPIETVPLKAKLLMLYSDNVTRILYYHPNMLNDDVYPIKWLPLPKANHE